MKKKEKNSKKTKQIEIKSLNIIPDTLFNDENITNVNATNSVKKIINTKRQNIRRKKTLSFALFIVCLSIIILLLVSLIKSFNFSHNVDNNKLSSFSVGNVITYKDVNYSVLNISSSSGTKYKKPQDGYQFLIVTIKIENKSDKRIKYSYNNWKMFNSLNEESLRVVSSLTAGKSLYTGVIVPGGSKTGSLVFEEPVDDTNLKLRFYDINKTNNSEISKLIFSVNIKLDEKAKK